MKLLAIDTSGKSSLWLGIDDSGPIAPVRIDVGKRHDEVLADGVRSWIEKQGWTTLDAIAVVVGPGGFTGLRVGVAFATGFAAALGVPVVPVTTYDILASSVHQGLVWTVPVSTRSEIRTRLMSGGESPDPMEAPQTAKPELLKAPVGKEPLTVLGEGFHRYEGLIRDLLGSRLQRSSADVSYEEALARAALHSYRTDGAHEPVDIDVDYGADFQPTPKPGE
jgi:tRNA threonylcarbamoyladenosine biosynthesis protein TsaB